MTVEHREKIGLGTWERDNKGSTLNDVDRGGFAWHYTWSEWELWDNDAAPERSSFVPMSWGERDMTPEALDMIKSSGATTLLGFNEPDHWTQSDMSVSRALQLWPQLEAAGLRLGSPAVTPSQALGATSWLGKFMAGAAAQDTRVDFIAVHYYSASKDVDAFRAFLEAVHRQHDKPVWVTEWALADWSNPSRFSTDEQAAFARAGVEMMDDLAFVEKHAWFASYEGGDGWHLNSGVFDATGGLTKVGQAFAELNAPTPELVGTGGADVLQGGARSERLLGLAGDDRLEGGAGDDTLDGGAGEDRLEGGAGDDTYVVDAAGDVIVERLNEGVDQVKASISHILGAHVENLMLTGTARIGGTGNDLGNRIVGNAGVNTLDGRAGRDLLEGGAGNDTYVIDAGDVVVELAGQGYDRVRAAISHALAAQVEELMLDGAANLTGSGNGSANRITGNAGANALAGGGGNDKLCGAAGNDSLDGGDGGDVLDGGAGDDLLRGGTGADAFVFAGGRDRVLDFVDDVDTLRVDDALWGAASRTVAEVLSFAASTNGAVRFDFGNGHALWVEGIASVDHLRDDLVIA